MPRLLPLLVLPVLAPSAAAQVVPSPDAPPEQVARAAFAALEARRFEDVPPLVDPRSLDDFRAEQVDRWCRDADLTPESFRRFNPGMTDEEVAEAIRSIREHEAREDGELRERFGVAGPDELERLPVAEVLARHLRAEDPVRVMERGLEEMRARVGEPSAEQMEAIRRTFSPRRVVLGAVEEDGGLAHVLYRFDHGPDAPRAPTMVHTLTLRRTAEGWRILLDWNFPLPANMNYGFFPAPDDVPPEDDASPEDGG